MNQRVYKGYFMTENKITRCICCMLILSMSFLFLLSGCGKKTDEVNTNIVGNVENKAMTSEMASDNGTSENEIELEQKIEEEKKAEEERRKAEEEDKKAEEERKKAEEERKKAEEEAKRKAEKEKNSFSMMYYLAITAESIRTAKDNRLALDDIYDTLLNDINPGAIDEITQEHLQSLRDIIKSYRNISTKRDRLQYNYNQNKAAAMRSAIPNPIAIFSTTQSLDWKKLAVNAVYTVLDSYTNYKSSNANAENEYLMSGWNLDDEELANIQKNRERAFDYMLDMVQEYELDGLKTLSEEDIQLFTEICTTIDSPTEKIKRLKAEEQKYEMLGNYWYELANCYFENVQYEQCIECTEKYIELSSGIYRVDNNLVLLLPKSIVAAQNTYYGDKYVSDIDGYAKMIMENTTSKDWSERYFVAQVYIDLYKKTSKQQYLKDAYKIISENVTVLLDGQREINDIYLSEVKEEVAVNPKTNREYNFLTKEKQKERNKEYAAEKKRVKRYNESLKKARKTELITLYEPLVLNCELLFALADKAKIGQEEKDDMDDILKNNIFLVEPIQNAYSFWKNSEEYNAELSKSEITLPASLLTSGSEIEISITDDDGKVVLDDCKVTRVEREGTTMDTFKVRISGKQWKKISWSQGLRITIKITYKDAYDKELVLDYEVGAIKEHWYGDDVEFVKK